MIRSYFISGRLHHVWCSVQVDVDDNDVIVWTADITRVFIGQKLERLTRWLKADVVDLINVAVV